MKSVRQHQSLYQTQVFYFWFVPSLWDTIGFFHPPLEVATRQAENPASTVQVSKEDKLIY